MAEDETLATGTEAEEQAARPPGMQILAQYIRDLSFENPHAPGSLAGETTQPNIGLEVELNARNRPDGLYELDLKLTATATRDGKAVFHAEIVYGGVFALHGLEQDRLEQVLLIECPRYLFPFARRIISDLTGEGGYTPLRIDPIDFGAIYLQRRAQVERDQAAAAVQNA